MGRHRTFLVLFICLALPVLAWFTALRLAPRILNEKLKNLGLSVSCARLRGNPFTGLTLHDLAVNGRDWRGSAAKVSLRFQLNALRQGHLRVDPVLISGGSFKLMKPPFEKFPVEKIELEAFLEDKKIYINSASFLLARIPLSVRGHMLLSPLSAELQAKSVAQDFNANLSLNAMKRWKLRLNIGALMIPKSIHLPISIRQPLLVELEAQGRDWTPRELAASGRFLIREREGMNMSGTMEADQGRISLTFNAQAAGLRGIREIKIKGWARRERAQPIQAQITGTLKGLRFQKEVIPRINFSVKGSTTSHVIRVAAQNLSWQGQAMGNARLEGSIQKETAKISEFVWKSPLGSARITGFIPLKKEKPFPDFNLTVVSDGLDMTLLAQRLPEPSILRPRLFGTLRLASRAGRMEARGNLHVEAGEFALKSIGITAKDIHAQVIGAGDHLLVREARGSSDGGSVSAKGLLTLDGPNLDIEGANLPFNHPAGFSGRGRGKIKLHGLWKSLRVEGDTFINEANYEPAPSSKTVQGPRVEAASTLAADIRIRFERNAWYRTLESAIEARGDLAIKKDPRYAARIFGWTELIRGNYSYYGRNFQMQEGTLTFYGNIPIDPNIRAKALHVEENTRTKIYLEANGPLSRFKTTLTSDPAMEERDLISILLVGRPLFEISRSTAPGSTPEKAREARRAAERLIAGYLTRGAKELFLKKIDLDLDVLQMRVKERKADVTVGKYITPKLFVSYGQTLGPRGTPRLATEYILTPRWSLEGRSTNEGTYILDFLFKYALDRRAPP